MSTTYCIIKVLLYFITVICYTQRANGRIDLSVD